MNNEQRVNLCILANSTSKVESTFHISDRLGYSSLKSKRTLRSQILPIITSHKTRLDGRNVRKRHDPKPPFLRSNRISYSFLLISPLFHSLSSPSPFVSPSLFRPILLHPSATFSFVPPDPWTGHARIFLSRVT